MKVGIYTLGCKVNTYESEYVINELKKNNYQICDFDDICDIYIINTCTVTNTSDIKSKKIIRRARQKNKDACIIAMGCFIQANPHLKLDEVDIAIGNKDKSRIIELLDEYFAKKKPIVNTYENIDEYFEDMYIEKFESRTRAFIKIQDGCENFCSYCIIPYVRGKCRSKPFNTVLKEVNNLVANGYKEIVLTGIHTGNYGVDINKKFSDLLKELIKIKGLKRLRISSIEITELTDEVLDIIKNSDIIVNHLHIPLQAGSDKVLKLMNRKYDIKYFINKINYIRSIKKDISITTDIIVGHPLEDEKTFYDSIETIKKINFSKIHVFPYSKRDGTVAATMEQVDPSLKKNRTKALLKLSKDLEEQYMKAFLNKDLEVLIERVKDDYSYGHTTNYLHIKVLGNYNSGDIIKVKIKTIDYPYCIGEEVCSVKI